MFFCFLFFYIFNFILFLFLFFFNLFSLTLSLLENLKNWIFEKSSIPKTLNMNILRTTIAKSINLNSIRKLVKYYSKKISSLAYYYCFWEDTPSKTKGLKFYGSSVKYSDFVKITWKRLTLTSLGGFKWFLFFYFFIYLFIYVLILFNPFSNRKIENNENENCMYLNLQTTTKINEC